MQHNRKLALALAQTTSILPSPKAMVRTKVALAGATVLNIFMTPIFRLIVEGHHFVQHPIKKGDQHLIVSIA